MGANGLVGGICVVDGKASEAGHAPDNALAPGRVANDPTLTAALLETIARISPDLIFAKDTQGRYIFVNPTHLAVLGKEAGAVLGHTDTEFHSIPAQTTAVMANDQRIMRSGITEAFEEIWDTADQGTRTFRSIKTPLHHDDGSVAGVACLSTDVTHLNEAIQRLEKVYETAPVGLCLIDRDMRFVMINDVLAEANGLPVEAHVGRTMSEVLGDFGAKLEGLYRHVIDTGEKLIDHHVSPEFFELPEEHRHWLLSLYPFGDQFGKTVGVNATVKEITEQKRMEQSLERAKAEAERAVLARSKFLAAASHDLRQPVQSLILLLAALKHTTDTEQIARVVGLMEDSLDGLNGLLNSILDISRIDARVVAPEFGSIDVGTMLHRLRDWYAPQCQLAGLRIRAHCPPGLHARTDAGLLERLLRNLIENSIRYTDSGGLLITARRRGDRIRIDIVDSGIGIPAENLENIFEEFFQVGNPARDRTHGLGLGLAIVNRIAELIGAVLRVRSRVGRGTCFSVTVPFDEALLLGSGPVPERKLAPGRRIMVIEDDAEVRKGLELLLQGWLCEVVSAKSGEEAIAIGEGMGWRIDAIIADHRLGAGLSGSATATEIARRAGRAVPTLIVTGYTDPLRINEVHSSGFEMIHKPVAADELKQRIAFLLPETTLVSSQAEKI